MKIRKINQSSVEKKIENKYGFSFVKPNDNDFGSIILEQDPLDKEKFVIEDFDLYKYHRFKRLF